MRVSTLIPLAALITSAFALSLPTSFDCASEPGSEICSSDLLPTPTDNVDVVDIVDRAPLTNAQRFARGLPPASPRRRHGHHGPSRTRTCSPSPIPPVTYRGVIQVFSGDVSLGYVADDPNYWTPLLTPDQTLAYKVDITLPAGATTGSELDLTVEGGFKGYTLLGVSVGRDSTSADIAPGSFNYGYIGATSHTDPGATPQQVPSFFSVSSGLAKPSESAVWSIDLTTGALSIQWVNTDSTKPATIIFVQSNHVYTGGDPAAFQARFPAPVAQVTLKFVQI